MFSPIARLFKYLGVWALKNFQYLGAWANRVYGAATNFILAVLFGIAGVLGSYELLPWQKLFSTPPSSYVIPKPPVVESESAPKIHLPEPNQTTSQNHPLNSPLFQNSPNATIYNYNYMLPAPSKTLEESLDRSKTTSPLFPPSIPSPILMPIPNSKLFISASGILKDDLTRSLQEAGFSIGSNQPDSAFIVDIDGPKVARAAVSQPTPYGARQMWRYTAKAKVTVTKRNENGPFLDPPEFTLTTLPSVDDTHGAAQARAQLVEEIVRYLRTHLKAN